MKIIYFDLCAIPVYLLVLWTCYTRKMNKGHANQIFVLVNVMSLLCAVVDLAMEFVVNPLPLAQWQVVLGTVLSYTYKIVRNATLVVYLIYIFAITRTEYRLRPLKVRLLLWLPNTALVALMVQNLFTHNLFVVTAEGGYARGPMLIWLYAGALFYGLAGAAYCVYCKRYLTSGKWTALISVYVLTFTGVFIQLVRPELLVEMFSTSLGIMMILLLVMRPEETIDPAVGIQNWNTYATDLRNVLLSRERVQILVFQTGNGMEVRSYLGEELYNGYMKAIIGELQALFQHQRLNVEVYFEHPDSIYLLLDDPNFDVAGLLPRFLDNARRSVKPFTDKGVRFEPRICLIRYPDDLTEMSDIISLGHKFPQLGRGDQTFLRASEIVRSRDFEIVNHMEEILDRAITQDTLEIYYQPIYDVKSGEFKSAEALARLKDSCYGMISPGMFIPAAEATGLILPLGEAIMERVFRFISQHDLQALGLAYIEINLSVAQVLQRDLPVTVRRLQEKYGVQPRQVNFEITETLYDNISDVMEANVTELKRMGYSFSLDDYGVGYSNIHRLNALPLDIIKIDKSLVDDMFSDDGEVIFRNTVSMMQGIHKKLVVEGVETKEESDALEDLSCDFIQGFYYSRPLPEEQFVRFLREHNRAA